jgi:hypothetical protein
MDEWYKEERFCSEGCWCLVPGGCATDHISERLPLAMVKSSCPVQPCSESTPIHRQPCVTKRRNMTLPIGILSHPPISSELYAPQQSNLHWRPAARPTIPLKAGSQLLEPMHSNRKVQSVVRTVGGSCAASYLLIYPSLADLELWALAI